MIQSSEGPLSFSLAEEMIAEQVRIWIETTVEPLGRQAKRVLVIPAPPMTRSSAGLRYGEEFANSDLHGLWYELSRKQSLPLLLALQESVQIQLLDHPEEALEPSAAWLREEFKAGGSEADRHANELYGRLVLEQIRGLSEHTIASTAKA